MNVKDELTSSVQNSSREVHVTVEDVSEQMKLVNRSQSIQPRARPSKDDKTFQKTFNVISDRILDGISSNAKQDIFFKPKNNEAESTPKDESKLKILDFSSQEAHPAANTTREQVKHSLELEI